MYYMKYTLKKKPYTVTIFPFDSKFISILYIILTSTDSDNFREVFKNGKMIVRQQIYNGVSYE